MVGFEIDLTALAQFADQAADQASAAVKGVLEQELGQAATTAKATTLFRDKTGALRASIGSKVEGDSLFEGGIVGTLYADAQHASFIEDGVSPHTISARNGTMTFQIGGRWVRVRSVKHPGIKARKFLFQSVSADQIAEKCERAVVQAWERG